MPKINSNGVKIGLVNKDNIEIAQVQLPLFCLEHMKQSSEYDNLNMMIKHISSKIPVKRLFLNGQELKGLTWKQCAQDVNFSFE